MWFEYRYVHWKGLSFILHVCPLWHPTKAQLSPLCFSSIAFHKKIGEVATRIIIGARNARCGSPCFGIKLRNRACPAEQRWSQRASLHEKTEKNDNHTYPVNLKVFKKEKS